MTNTTVDFGELIVNDALKQIYKELKKIDETEKEIARLEDEINESYEYMDDLKRMIGREKVLAKMDETDEVIKSLESELECLRTEEDIHLEGYDEVSWKLELAYKYRDTLERMLD